MTKPEPAPRAFTAPGGSLDKAEEVRKSLSGGQSIHQTWQSVYRNEDTETFARQYFEWIIRRLRLTPEQTILDAGCGTAFNAVRLAKAGLNVDGVDFSEFAIEEGRAFVEANGVADSVTLRPGDLTRLAIPSNSYDVVMCLGVLMHIPDVERAIDELIRVTKPGGVLLISEANRASPEYALSRVYWRFWSKRITVEPHRGYTNVWWSDGEQRLLSRKFSLRWLINRFECGGMALMWKKSASLTELYTRAPRRWLRRIILKGNLAWFRFGGPAVLASANLIAFRKRSEADG